VANEERSHRANRRPPSVTFIGCLFIGAGVIGIAYHATKFSVDEPFQHELMWVLSLRLLAVIGGFFVLWGANWARWLLLFWTAYHVVLSAFHSLPELVVHSVLLAVIAYLLLRSQTSAYFRRAK
jgi:hypothetical protein